MSVSVFGQDNIALVGSKIELGKTTKSSFDEAALESSFEFYDRMIIVEANLNGVKGKYILDTGSPMLMLNQKPKIGDSQIGGIAEKCDAEYIEVREFKWAGISKKSIEALAFDMSNLEKSLGTSIDGLIGQNVFKSYELYLDIAQQKIQLFKARRSSLHKKRKFQKRVSFSMEKHIPVITVKIDGKKYRFGIDTGAEVNVLSQELKNDLEDSLENFNHSTIQGIGGLPQKVESATLSQFSIKKENFKNFNFLLIDFSSFENDFGLNLDGILGYPFLKENVLSINYQKQKIYIW